MARGTRQHGVFAVSVGELFLRFDNAIRYTCKNILSESFQFTSCYSKMPYLSTSTILLLPTIVSNTNKTEILSVSEV